MQTSLVTPAIMRFLRPDAVAEHAKAASFQQLMAARAVAPLRAAGLARTLAESPLGARAGLALARRVPTALHRLIEASRIAPDTPLAPRATAP